jgi:ADP-heptose:LPS heptosyltransferase
MWPGGTFGARARGVYTVAVMAPRRFPILFITSSRIGDAVLSSGLIKSLVDEVEGARFTIVASRLTAPLFEHVPGLDRIIEMEKQPFSAHWVGLWRQVRQTHWGLVVDTRGSGISGLLRRSRRAVHKSGGDVVHKVVEAARLLQLEASPPAPYLYVTDAERARAERLIAGEGPILAMAPAANWVGKMWPAEHFAQVARTLLGAGGELAGGRLMVLGGPGDRGVAAPLLTAAPKGRRIDLLDRESLLVVFAALSRARLFIGGDSGLMHLAAAAGAPTLGLFGPSDERLYAPWSQHGRIVRGARTFEEIRSGDPRLSNPVCHMTDLRASAVIAAARKLLAETASEPTHAGEVHA